MGVLCGISLLAMASQTTPATRVGGSGGNSFPAGCYMLITVSGISLVPLLVNVSGGAETPFLFSAYLRTGSSIACVLFLLIFHHSTLFNSNTLLMVRHRVFVWPDNRLLVLAGVAALDYAFFALSLKFIDVAVAAILFETWPVFIILLAAWLFRGEGRFRKIGFGTVGLICLSLAGFVFAVASQGAGFSSLDLGLFWRAVFGVALVVVGTVLAALPAFGWRWSADLSNDLSGESGGGSLDLFCLVVSLLVANCFSIGACLSIGLVGGERISVDAVVVAIIGGIYAHGVATIALRKANFTTDNLGINALAFATPVLSLVWLFSLSQVDVARFDYLVIGAAAIITANLLINFEAEIRWGFKALLLSLVSCGATVYLRDGVFVFLGVDQWNWTGSGYFESITLAATVFTLLLAFRVARLVGRTTEEDNRTFIIYRKLDMLARRDVISGEVCDHVLDIDRARNNSATEKEAYTSALLLIAGVDPKALDEADRQLLSDAAANLDALARSKQVDMHLGEQFALGIFAAITIGLALFSRPPQVDGWTRLLVDLFAMLISAVVIFLLFHIQDLQRERDDRKLEALERLRERPLYSVRFLDTGGRSFDQWLSIVVGAGLVVTYGALLAHRWLGLFG